MLWSQVEVSPEPVDGKVKETQVKVTAEESSGVESELQRLAAERQEFARTAAELKREVEALRSQVKQVGDQQAAQGTDAVQAGQQGAVLSPAAEHEAETVAMSPEEERQQIEEQSLAQVDLIEAAVLTEEVDEEWGPQAQQTLGDLFENEEMTGMYLLGADCRTSMCRMEVAFDETVSPEKGLGTLADNAPWQGEGFVRIGLGDDPSVVVYLAREGQSLPHSIN